MQTLPLRACVQYRDLNNPRVMQGFLPLSDTRTSFDVKEGHLSEPPWERLFGFQPGALRCCEPPDIEDVESWYDPLYCDVDQPEPFTLRFEDSMKVGHGPDQRPPFFLRGKEL